MSRIDSGHLKIYTGRHFQNGRHNTAQIQHCSISKVGFDLFFKPVVGDRPVLRLLFGPRCHELFVILYSIHTNLSDNMFCYCISKTKNEFGQNPEENIIFIGLCQYTKLLINSILLLSIQPKLSLYLVFY